MIQIKTFTFNGFQENTYILFDDSKQCVIIDPGCYEKAEKEKLLDYINENQLKPVKLLNTHCHIDHVLGNHFVAQKWNLELEMHHEDLPTLKSVQDYCQVYGFHDYELSPEPSVFLAEGDQVTFGNSSLNVLFTPGHAPGHIVFHSEAQNFVIGGDVLFKMSIGRTDLPGGDFNTLINSIESKLLPLDEDTIIYCGHGPSTSIGFEKSNNPFLK